MMVTTVMTQAEPHVWHTLSIADVLRELATGERGLASTEVKTRLEQHGTNELQAVARVSAMRVFAGQFRNVLIWILLAATAVSAALGHTVETIAIAVIVLFSGVLGFVQEYRAERALEALQKMAAPKARVIRDGREAVVDARDVVPGEIVLLQAGDRIPADGRLLETVTLAVDESALTGESTPADKIVELLPQADLPLGDRRNLVFAGTLVIKGHGRAAVTATGMSTEFGRISGMVQTIEAGRTPLQQNLDRLAGTLGRAALALVALVVAMGYARGMPLLDMFMFGIALAVAVVPEALPAVVTISLALGVRRMVRRHVLVRRLPVVETLGSTSVICSDKTGTLTKNQMTVRRLAVDGHLIEVSGAGYEPQGEFTAGGRRLDPPPAAQELLRAGALASDSKLVQRDGRWQVEGDPTEGALIVAAQKAGLNHAELSARSPRIAELPFTSERRRMTTLHQNGTDTSAYSKGALDAILPGCRAHLRGGQETLLTDSDRDQIGTGERDLAAAGLRVLAIARKRGATPETAEREMTFLGLVGMMDPPRPEAKAAVHTCQRAGITPVMITGDHPLTARAIAHELGLLRERRVVSGQDLDGMNEQQLEKSIGEIGVYARVSPAHKLRVVEGWQKRRAIVAMTGDGVNDAPALKKADVGIAMGIAGTDVSKEAAAITLLDDNFASIVAAVEEGRIVFGNIKKYLVYLLSCNAGEILLMGGAVVAGLPMPLTAVQILYVNLATDGLPALALAVDPADRDLMERQPRNPRTGIFTRPVVALLSGTGACAGLVTLSLFAWMQNQRSAEEAMAVTFVTLVLLQFFNAYNSRSDRSSVLRGLFANKWLNAAILWEVALLAAIVYTPLMQRAFGTFPLTARDWLLVATFAATVVPVSELIKWMVRRGWFGRLE
jgi:Ca2+-transporting ATPase